MARKVVKIASATERDVLAPHIEAHLRFVRVVNAVGPAEQGIKFDLETLTWYVDDDLPGG